MAGAIANSKEMMWCRYPVIFQAIHDHVTIEIRILKGDTEIARVSTHPKCFSQKKELEEVFKLLLDQLEMWAVTLDEKEIPFYSRSDVITYRQHLNECQELYANLMYFSNLLKEDN